MLVFKIGYTPDTADQQLGMLLDRVRINQHSANTQIGKGRFIYVAFVVQTDADLVDDFVTSALTDVRAYQSGFAAMHIMLTENVLDRLDARLDGCLIVCRTVLAEQILQHIGGDNGIAFDRFDQVLANHQSGKHLVYFGIKRAHLGILHHQKSKSLVNERRSW